MKTPAFILTENSLTVSVEGKTYTINSGHPSWKQAIESLKRKDYQALKDLVSVQKAFCSFTGDKVKIVDNQVFFNGEPINSYLSEKILSFMEKGLPHESLIKFLERLMANPSRRAVTELYSFLRHKSLPITDDGTFLAYKSVRSDYTDHHTGNFNNSIGNALEMTRNNVCDDHSQGCSIGFHAGSLEYASSFGGADSVLLIVEIDPADVVSVPSDCECQKLRTCKYKVVAKYDGKEFLAPTLTTEIIKEHSNMGKMQVAIYPEITMGNPLQSKYVIRWLLNKPNNFLQNWFGDFDEDEFIAIEKALEEALKEIRKKLNLTKDQDLIKTIRGIGYIAND